MNTAQRDAVLRMMLPALAIVVLYFAGFNRQTQLTAAQQILEGVKGAAVSPAELLPLQADLTAETAKQNDLKTEKQAVDERWTQLAALRTNSPAERANSLRQLTRMLWDRGLVPYEEAPEDRSAGQGQLPGSFDDVLKKLSTPQDGTANAPPRLWRIRFYGRYPDVVRTLTLLGDTDLALVPVGLSMSEAHPDTDWRLWTLLLWN